MTRKSGKTLDLLRGLLSERQQYEQWLAALANKRADTSDQVYERVHSDYQSRLDGVLSKLASHAEELQGSMVELTSRIDEVTKREDSRRDERQEAELRAAVGEFTPEKWEEVKTAAEADLAAIAEERTGLEKQHAEVSEIIAVVQGRIPVEEPTIQAEVEPPPVVESVRAPGGQESGRAATESEQIVAEDPTSAGMTSNYRPPIDPLAEVGEAAIPFPDWEAPLQSASKVASATASRGAPEVTRPEQQKTLRCPDCATMNFPTEWYCEQCGGELAAL